MAMSIITPFFLVLLGLLVKGTKCHNFPYEDIQLHDSDIGDFSAIGFGNATTSAGDNSRTNRPACRAFPGTAEWPRQAEWSRLNTSLGGALLQPTPPGAVCYLGPNYDSVKCDYLLNNASSGRFYVDDPVTILTQWPQGQTCYPTTNPSNGTCTKGGFPKYVVNVTTVKQVQAAVNFARNKNTRLVIKNTGHDFEGRSAGAGSLSVWTHFLKSFEYLPQYNQGNYSGRAVKVGVGVETWEAYQYMDQYDITLVVAGAGTVGTFGGWMQGGGHSVLSSTYGLGADQVLSLEVVTADGRFVTASPTSHPDLYFALRGGGGSTYGIVTSMIYRAYPRIRVTNTELSFQTIDGPPPRIGFIGGRDPFTLGITTNITKFWQGVDIYWAFTKNFTSVGGAGYSFLAPMEDTTKNLTGTNFFMTVRMPNMLPDEVFAFFQPLFDVLTEIGIVGLKNPEPVSPINWGPVRSGAGSRPGNSRFSTRLLPASNWENQTLFHETTKAIRKIAEAGYTYHGVSITPDEKAAGYEYDQGIVPNAVNPAFRRAIQHADVFDYNDYGSDTVAINAAHERLDGYMNGLRAVTPGSGAYFNEADMLEPNWQQSFFGSNYGRLLGIKRKYDPWSVFWAETTVGGEGWEVRHPEGWPTQNGRLCRVEGKEGKGKTK